MTTTSNNPTLLAFSKEGILKWSYDNGLSSSTPVIGKTGLIYIGGNVLTALNPDGSVNWNVVTFRRASGAPAIAPSGRLYLPASSTLFALEVEDTGLANAAWPMEGQSINNAACVFNCI